MTQNPTMKGEKIYEYEFDLTGVTDYGVSMDAILSGKETVPLQGARFDLTVDGRGKGRLSGRARGRKNLVGNLAFSYQLLAVSQTGGRRRFPAESCELTADSFTS